MTIREAIDTIKSTRTKMHLLAEDYSNLLYLSSLAEDDCGEDCDHAWEALKINYPGLIVDKTSREMGPKLMIYLRPYDVYKYEKNCLTEKRPTETWWEIVKKEDDKYIVKIEVYPSWNAKIRVEVALKYVEDYLPPVEVTTTVPGSLVKILKEREF